MTEDLGGSELPTGGSASLFQGEALRDLVPLRPHPHRVATVKASPPSSLPHPSFLE